jgi:hypothetical protein
VDKVIAISVPCTPRIVVQTISFVQTRFASLLS